MKKILTILAVMAVFVASFAAKAQDRTCKTDSICGREIVKSAMKYLGSPYRSGHMSPKSGFDCSGFTTFIFSKQNISLPRSSRSQYSALRGDSQVKDRRDLKAGDLVFFSGSRASKSNVGHVGIVTSVDESGNFKLSTQAVRKASRYRRHRKPTTQSATSVHAVWLTENKT